MFYDRKIKYLEDRKDGEHIRTVGFVKAEVRGELCRMSIHVAGLHGTDTFDKSILVLGGGREGKLCDIKLVGGRGDTGELCFQSDRLGRGGISYEELEEIRIPLAAGRELRCLWKNKETETARVERNMAQERVSKESISQKDISKESMQKEGMTQAAVPKETIVQIDMPQESAPQTDVLPKKPSQEMMFKEDNTFSRRSSQENILKQDISAESMPKESMPRTDISKADIFIDDEAFENIRENESQTLEENEKADAASSPNTSQQEKSSSDTFRRPMMEDKWHQLCAIYPHIAPFQDEREYLSIEPRDFVIFPVKYYQLVNNSFLLHGYHNYQHLILTRILYRGEIRYYIGVPGNYYEKEKQVAIMFGFESFECKAEPAQTGDYGYYMMRIAL